MKTSLKNKIKYISVILLLTLGLISYGCNINHYEENIDKITIYFSDENLMFLVPVTYQAEKGTINPQKAIELLISKNPPDSHLISLFPEKCQLLGFEIKNNIAILNLSKEFKKAFQVGGLEGTCLINSIKYTLSHFQEIKGIKLLIEGKEVDVLGELDLKGELEIEKWKNLFLTGKENRVQGDENRCTVYLSVPQTDFLVPVTCVFEKKEDLPRQVINRLTRGLDEGWAEPSIPEGTELLDLRIENNTACIDFNSSFIKLKNDKEGEKIINAIAFSLTEFEDIKDIQITAEGKNINKYGNASLADKITRPLYINLVKSDVSMQEVTPGSESR